MTEKFSIIKQLDTEKLNEKIAYFVYENGHEPYIFANHETLESLTKPYEQSLLFYTGRTGLICRYKCYKVFEDYTLDFGEIELR